MTPTYIPLTGLRVLAEADGDLPERECSVEIDTGGSDVFVRDTDGRPSVRNRLRVIVLDAAEYKRRRIGIAVDAAKVAA